MFIPRQSGCLQEHIERCPAADIGCGNHRLQSYQAIFIRGGPPQDLDGIGQVTMPVTQLARGRRTGMVFFTGKDLSKQIRVHLVDIAVHPDGLYLVMPVPGIVLVQGSHPAVEFLSNRRRILVPQFTLGPVAIPVFTSLENLQQVFNRLTSDHRGIHQWPVHRCDSPDPSGLPISTAIPQRVLAVALDRVVPITDVHCPTRSVAQIHGDETEVGGVNQVRLVLFTIMVLVFHPLVDFHTVRRLVTNLDEVFPLQLVGKMSHVHEFLAADSRVGRQASWTGMSSRVCRVHGVEGGGKDRMTCQVLSPVIKGDAPRVGAVVHAEGGQPVRAGAVTEPAAIGQPDRTISGLHLAVMEDRLAGHQVPVRSPDNVVQGMMRILRAKSGQHVPPQIGLAIPVGVLEKCQVGSLGNINTPIAKLKGEWNVQAGGKDAALVCLAVAVPILQDQQFVIRLISRVDMGVGPGGRHPEPALAIPSHLDGTGKFREILLGSEAVDLESRIHLEGSHLVIGAEPFIRPSRLLGRGKRWGVGVIDFLRDLIPSSQDPDAVVPVVNHHVQSGHGGQEVQLPVSLGPTPNVVKGIDRAVAVMELLVFLQNLLAQVFVHRRRTLLEETPVQRLGKSPVTLLVKMDAVASEGLVGLLVGLSRRFEKINETDFMLSRSSFHHRRVNLEPVVVPGSCVRFLDILAGDR